MSNFIQERIEKNIEFCLSLTEHTVIFWVLFVIGFFVLPILYIFCRKEKTSWDAAIFAPVFLAMIFYQPTFSFLCRLESFSYKDVKANSLLSPPLPEAKKTAPVALMNNPPQPNKVNNGCANLVKDGNFFEGLYHWDGSLLERTKNLPRGFWSSVWRYDPSGAPPLAQIITAEAESIEGTSMLKVTNNLPQIQAHAYGTFAQQILIPSENEDAEFIFLVHYKTDDRYKDNSASFAFSEDWSERFHLEKSADWKWGYKSLGKISKQFTVRFISENLGTVWLQEIRVLPKNCLKIK